MSLVRIQAGPLKNFQYTISIPSEACYKVAVDGSPPASAKAQAFAGRESIRAHIILANISKRYKEGVPGPILGASTTKSKYTLQGKLL